MIRLIGKIQLLAVLLVVSCGLQAQAQEVVPGEYLILLKPQAQPSTLLNSLQVRSFELFGRSLRLIKIPMTSSFVFQMLHEKLMDLPEVELMEPNFVYHLESGSQAEGAVNVIPNDPEFKKAWNLNNIGQADGWGRAGRVGIDTGVGKAWDIQRGTKSVVVAVIDSGLNYKHPEFVDNLWVNRAEQAGKPGVDDDNNGLVDDINGYDFVNSDADPMDDHGHGSHVASIIGARGNNAVGMAGINWEISLMPLKFASKEGKGTLELGIRAIQYATQMGARIINNSWGGQGYSEILTKVVEEAHQKGVLLVAAAGNSGGDNAETPIFPASLKNENVLSVAAFDQHGQLWNNSCYGETTVHLGAPGVEILGLWGEKYRSMTGTSLAAPHVTGVAALLLAQEPQLTVGELKSRLLATAKPIANLRGKTISGATVDALYALKNQPAPLNEEDPFYWQKKQAVAISSQHPYQNQAKQEWEVSIAGAKEISLFFQNFELEHRTDHVDLHDRSGARIYVLTGKTGKGWSPIIKGDYVKVVLVSDTANNAYGFDVKEAAYR